MEQPYFLSTHSTYSSVRKLVKLSAVQFMLNNHTVSCRPGMGGGGVRGAHSVQGASLKGSCSLRPSPLL